MWCALDFRRVKKCKVAWLPPVPSLDGPRIGCTGKSVMSRSALLPMTSRAALIAFLAAVLATISSLAYASPADPTWIPGVYDDADFDDVVGLVTSAEALATTASAA